MDASSRYAVVVAPDALAQMEAALLWWSSHRNKAPELLTGEIEAALAWIEIAPECGRRVTSRLFRGVRRLLLRRTGYHLDYQVVDSVGEVRVVHFRHARRRPR